MDGLIVKEPFATNLVNGTKQFEFRRTKIPKNKIGVPVLILTPASDGCKVMGEATFFPTKSDDWIWRCTDPTSYIGSEMHYKSKNGCVIWINNVEILS